MRHKKNKIYRQQMSSFKHQMHYKKAESYRKDDHAMRRIYRCPENFRESLGTPTSTKFLMGFCSDRSYERAYKIWSSFL